MYVLQSFLDVLADPSVVVLSPHEAHMVPGVLTVGSVHACAAASGDSLVSGTAP